MSDKYTFSKADLEEITKIVSIKNVEAASKKFCNRPYVFFDLRKVDKELNEAIEKGQALRKQNTEVNKAIEYFSKFTGKELAELNKFVINYGVQKMPEQYGFKMITINNARKELPQLDKVIKDGIKAKRSVVATLGYRKRNKEKPNKAKKIQVIVNTTLSGISDQTEVNLANFKKMMERNKQLEHVKRLKNGDFNNMV